jgi:uroporphyrinogen-III synthase
VKFTHVLITRPAAEAAELAERLAGTGLALVILPAYRFEPAYPGFDLSRAWPVEGRRLAIFSSTRAVDYGLRQLPAGFLDNVEVAAIGPATANALEAAGYPPSIVPEQGYTSEDLLGHPDLATASGMALIFAAPGGRRKLRQALGARGWSVRMAMVYQRIELEPAAAQVAMLEQAGPTVSVWTSASAVQILQAALPPEVWRKICQGACVATSARLRDRLEAAGAGVVRVTDGPGNEAIGECILQLI